MAFKKINLHTLYKILLLGLSFIIPYLITHNVLSQYGFYPFGDKSLLITDMDSQYVQFYESLRQIINGDGSIFFSWNKQMGTSFIGLFAYYLSSPITFLALLFDKGDMELTLFYLTVIKISLCGVTSFLYFKYTFKYNKLPVLIFSSSYALISYNIVYSMSLMWLDGVILLPIILLGAEKILRGEKPYLFIISLSVMFAANYYITFMICIFIVLFTACRYLMLHKKLIKSQIIKTAKRFFIYAAFSFGTSLWLILPTIFCLSSGRLSGGFMFPYYPVNFPLAKLLSSFMQGEYSSITNSGIPALYCGFIILLMFAAFFIVNSTSTRKKMTALCLTIFMLLSFYLSVLDTMWHGLSLPSWFPYRYSFVFSFFMIFIAFYWFYNTKDRFKIVLQKAANKIKLNSNPTQNIFIKTFCIIITVGGLLFTAFDLNANSTALIAGLDNEHTYSQVQSRKKFYAEHFELLDCIKKHEGFYKLLSSTIPLSSSPSSLPSSSPSFYRVEKTYMHNLNDPMGLNYKGMSHYSSTFNNDFNEFTKQHGFAQGYFWSSYSGSTIITDSIFNVKYILSKTKMPNDYVNIQKTLLFQEAENLPKDISVYKNPYVLPVGFMVENNVYTPVPVPTAAHFSGGGVDAENISPAVENADAENISPSVEDMVNEYNYFEAQNNLLNTFCGDDVKYFKRVQNVQKNDEAMEYTFTAENDKPIYISFPANNYLKGELSVNGKFISNYFSKAETNHILFLGHFKKGEKVTLDFDFNQNDLDLLGENIYYFDTENFTNAINKLRKGGLYDITHTNTSLKGNVNAEKDGKMFISIPYDKGFTVKIDGRKTNYSSFKDTFIIFDVEKGQHEIEISFTPQGFTFGLILSIISILTMIIWFNRKRLSNYILNNE